MINRRPSVFALLMLCFTAILFAGPVQTASGDQAGLLEAAVDEAELPAFPAPAGTAGPSLTALETCPPSTFSPALNQLGGMILGDALPRAKETEQRIAAQHLLRMGSMLTSYAPTIYDTSVFLTDKIAVGIIFPESDGSLDPNTEDWTEFEMNCVVSKIQTGMEWWKTHAGTTANVSFVYDPHKVSTRYEPINRSEPEVNLWMSDTMTNLGYVGSGSIYQTYAYAAYLRSHYNAQWAVVYYVADSSNDPDGKFAGSDYFAFASLGGPDIVMTLTNDGWGIENMNWVAAHEFGHSFWAGDQYFQEDYGGCTSTTQRYGYLGVANSNCQYNNPGSVPSIMRSNEDVLDASAAGQVGWKDSNANSIYDVVDTNPVFNIPVHDPNPTTETSWIYTGEVYDQPWPHAACAWDDLCLNYDVTINTISSASFRVDGGAWNPVMAMDGAFDSASEQITFSTPTLAAGTHTIEVQAVNSRGSISSIYWSDTVTVRDCRTLSITVNPAYAGSVSATPPYCGSQYNNGSVVSLTAQPNSAFTFGNWSGDASGTSTTTTVTMLANRAVTANFKNRVPTLTSIIPTNTTAGGSTFTLTLTGTNFVPDSVVRWNEVALTTTYVSATSLMASVPAANIVTGGSVPVTVYNPAPGGGTSNGQAFTINNLIPTLSSIYPPSATAGGSTFALSVTGTNFVSTSKIRWNGTDLATTYVSATSLTASVPAGNISTAGMVPVTVFNPTPAGGTSGEQTITINNPLPVLTIINPTSAITGGTNFSLSMTGANFVATSKVRWNGADLTTTYISATSLTAVVPASNITSAGSAEVTVFNPTPGGGTSALQAFTIDNPLPVLISISPTSITAGGTAFTLTVTGTNFMTTSKVRWNGIDLTTTFGSATSLTASVPAVNIAAAGSALVTVYTPAPGGGTAASQTFTINHPTPALTSINPVSTTAGGSTFTLTVAGSSFVAASQVRWNGADLATTYVSATTLEASVPAAAIAAGGSFPVTVFTPTPGGGTSTAVSFIVNNPTPALTSTSPSSATIGCGSFTLTVHGTDFVNDSTVLWNDTPLDTTFYSSTLLTALVSAGNIVTSGTVPLKVFNPVPGGGASNELPFSINNPIPIVTGVTPGLIRVSATGVLITVHGTGFVNGAIVRWNGESLATIDVDATSLTAIIPDSKLTHPGSAFITVSNPGPGGGVSGEVEVKIGAYILFLATIVK